MTNFVAPVRIVDLDEDHCGSRRIDSNATHTIVRALLPARIEAQAARRDGTVRLTHPVPQLVPVPTTV